MAARWWPGGPGPRLAEDDRNAERLIAVTPGFEAATQMDYAPTTLLLNREGTIVWSSVGPLSGESWQAALATFNQSFLVTLLRGLRTRPPLLQSAISLAGGEQRPTLVGRAFSFNSDGVPAFGEATAKVTVIEFVDYQCPFCARAVGELKDLVYHHPGEVRLIVKQFPLSIHPHAERAALAALAAGNAHQFWEMHDALFAMQRDLSEESIQQLTAATLGSANPAEADAFLRQKLQTDVREGIAADVNATPTLFVNGRLYSGAVDEHSLWEVIAPLAK